MEVANKIEITAQQLDLIIAILNEIFVRTGDESVFKIIEVLIKSQTK